MMGKRHLALVLWVATTFPVVAQVDSYWQQRVDHTIKATLDDTLHMIFAEETVKYHNQSPDTLEYLIFHLWPNAYKNRNTALAKQSVRMGQTEMLFALPEDLGFIDGLAFELDGKPCVWEFHPKHIDICTLYLERPLLPGESVEISTPFRVKLPSGKISRLGHIDQSYQITQWFPKPAVYDKKGWHAMPYLTLGEFYSEYGSYDVTISVPSNYVVGATGDLQTRSEIEFLESRVAETKQWIEKVESDDEWSTTSKEMDFPESDYTYKTLNYTQNNIHDFAWFADKRYHVLNGKVALPGSGDSATVWTMFTNKEARLWKESIEYMHDAIYYYSLWSGDYPYQQATAVDGTISAGGGMEYPNVTVIGSSGDAISLETVIMHEVGHNWFYGILGSNERRYAWMDEGLNSYNELRYLDTKYPDGHPFVGNNSNSKLIEFAGLDQYRLRDIHYLTYLFAARDNLDQPLNTTSSKFSQLNYGAVVYSKSAVWFNYLRHYLGDSLMDATMHAYFDAFKFKHPAPEDFKQVVESTSKKELDWLFDKGIDSTAKIDFKISSASLTDSVSKVVVKNNGGVASPIPVAFYMEGKEVYRTWLEGFNGKQTIEYNGDADHVVLDPDRIVPELRRDNNHSDLTGTFKRMEPIEFKFVGQLEDPTKSEVYWLPLLSATVPGGFTPGVAFYNSIIPVRKLNWVIAPMFSTKSLSASGMGEIYYSLTPELSLFQNIDLGVRGRSFTADNVFLNNDVLHRNYYRIEPYVRFNLRPYRPSGLWDDEFTLSTVIVGEDQLAGLIGAPEVDRFVSSKIFTRFTYQGRWNHPAYGTDFKLGGEVFEEFLRGSIEIVNQIELDDYMKMRNRVFVGAFFSNNSNNPVYNYRMDGQSAWNDYAYDGLFVDRSRGDALLSRQLTETHGGFKIPTAVGSSNLGLIAYNTEILVMNFPIGLFGDVGYDLNGNFAYDAGLCLTGKRHIFGVYLPLIYSDNIAQEVSANGRGWLDLIRFQFDLFRINPMELRKRIQI